MEWQEICQKFAWEMENAMEKLYFLKLLKLIMGAWKLVKTNQTVPGLVTISKTRIVICFLHATGFRLRLLEQLGNLFFIQLFLMNISS